MREVKAGRNGIGGSPLWPIGLGLQERKFGKRADVR
jgi:hypothetical protein